MAPDALMRVCLPGSSFICMLVRLSPSIYVCVSIYVCWGVAELSQSDPEQEVAGGQGHDGHFLDHRNARASQSGKHHTT
jgi:hypothetical protein